MENYEFKDYLKKTMEACREDIESKMDEILLTDSQREMALMEKKHPLARWRKKQNPAITQEDLAVIMGCNKITISNWERGHSMPAIKYLLKLKDFTEGEITPNHFL